MKKEQVKTAGGVRKGSGRKKVKDKKYVYFIYVRDSIVKKNGGKDKMFTKIYKHIGQD